MIESLNESIESLPNHLRKYVVDQHYDRYTPEDQAVWRFIMRQLKNYLSTQAHECYLEGLEKTGLRVNRIPEISEVHEKLQEFGWKAIPVSGFIPPAAFMEFQARGFLPIASDMRTVNHILYTPAPDIVHEAAGHAPILIDKDFANYLKSYAEVASKAIISSEDIDLYLAIRRLSDIKEQPSSTDEEIQAAEENLEEVKNNISFLSEASLLGRMNWWTAEYGLIGDLEEPKIFGAGLLSSVGEARNCLKPSVKKIPLSIECIDYNYDITEPQPQLFVTPDFSTLVRVLDELADMMAFRKGGEYGLKKAIEAKTINTVELDSGLQISGRLEGYSLDSTGEVSFVRFSGGTQLSLNNQEIKGHGTQYHSHGYSTPLGRIVDLNKPLFNLSENEKDKLGLKEGASLTLEFTSGITIKGKLVKTLEKNEQLILLTFEDCHVSDGDNTLFQPEWGTFDLATGEKISSVFGGPADRPNFSEENEFKPQSVPEKKFSSEQKAVHDFYRKIRELRESSESKEQKSKSLHQYIEIYLQQFDHVWLAGLELLELCYRYNLENQTMTKLLEQLKSTLKNSSGEKKECLSLGIELADKAL